MLQETSSSLGPSCDRCSALVSSRTRCKSHRQYSASDCCCSCNYTYFAGSSSSSLRSYQKQDEEKKRHDPSSFLANLTREEASKLLESRLREFGPSAGDQLQVTSENEQYSFTSPAGHKIDLSIPNDMKGVAITTVIHRVKQPAPRRGEMISRRHRVHPRRGSYSLMTKMMKCNVELSQTPSGFGHILTLDGTFVFYALASMTCLTHKDKLVLILEDTILKAMEISKEFADTPSRRSFPSGA